MKFNKEIYSLYSYFIRRFKSEEQSCIPAIPIELLEKVYNNKILHWYLSLHSQKYQLDTWAEKRLRIYEDKALIHQKILERLSGIVEERNYLVLKGERLRSFYPQWFKRESRDIDILFRNEHDFINVHNYLLLIGFREQFVWLRKTVNGMAASAKFRIKNNAGDRALDDIYVEIHSNAFPVTNFSDLYFFQLEKLTERTQIALLLIAEFTFRDDVIKKFTLRDMLDVYVIFSYLDRSEWDQLKDKLHEARLEAPTFLLADFWSKEMKEPMPECVAWLCSEFERECTSVNYSILENQSWLFQQKIGTSRAVFDYLVQTHSSLYDSPRTTAENYSEEMLLSLMHQGMPVMARKKIDNTDTTLLSAYSIHDRFIY